ncbi:MAG: glycosyltransferase [Paludibacteraceae bacterium]|nr:glycosyltransferase [Paludibacteraceae bacterium]
MRVLLSNKFYYRRGGDCIYTMELERLLKSKGHEVAIFAMDYPENQSSEWSRYWPSNMSVVKAFSRPFGDSEVRRKFSALLDDFKPDVVHLNNIHTQLSPVIAEIAHDRGIRVVWTLHDSKLVCPCYTCMRDGKWCTECFTDKKAVVKHRCMPGSLPGAVVGYLEAKKWNKERLQKSCDLFLPPSQFMADTCIQGGYDADKFRVLCNFIDIKKVENPSFEKSDYYVYLGRLTKVKGIETLCRVAAELPYKLVVIGGGELEPELRSKYGNANIEFLGQQKWEEFRPVLEGARFMVIPSEWSENNPLTVIESLALGTPVLGANIGGIPELIEPGVSGMTFESGDQKDLKNKIERMWNASFDYEAISMSAQSRYSSDKYVEQIVDIYNI